jgi:SAM-dependent methyltransferase
VNKLDYARVVKLHSAILSDFGHVLTSPSRLLDFGCGAGELVHAYRAAGVDADGADVHLDAPGPHLFFIRDSDYRLPFADCTFDVVVSNMVFEHVRDIDSVLLEINRVLKPGGASLHLFPPSGRPIEGHVFVPFGGLLRAPWWLALWALVGVRNGYQHQLGWREVARSNRAYLTTKTFYRSKRAWQSALMPTFEHVTFANRAMLRHSYGRARYLAPVAPLVGSLYGACHLRCLFFEKRRTASRSERDSSQTASRPR